MPKQLMIETISACNLKCKMCAHRNSMTGIVLQKDIISGILRDIQKINGTDGLQSFAGIRLDGNTEPLIYKDLAWLIREIKNVLPSDFPICVVTNGVLLNGEMSALLLGSAVHSIHISVTGVSGKVYGEFQGSNLSQAVCEKNLGTVVRNIAALIKMKKEMGAKTIVVPRYILSGASKDEFVEYLDYWREQGADRVHVMGLGDGVLKTETAALGKVVKHRRCSRFGQVVVLATGDVLLSCCDYRMESVGNAHEKSFFEIMASEKVREYEKSHECLDRGKMPPICRNCPDIHVYEELEDEETPLHAQYRDMLAGMGKNRKLIIWGVGAECELFRKSYIYDRKIAYFVDNDPSRWGRRLDGAEIRHPDVLRGENPDGIFILIASTHFYSIQRQLSAWGIANRYPTPLFLDRYIEKAHQNVIYFN